METGRGGGGGGGRKGEQRRVRVREGGRERGETEKKQLEREMVVPHSHPGQASWRDQHNTVEVEPVNALYCWHHIVHPCEGLFVSAGGPLLRHYHDTLTSQSSD